MGDTQKSSSGRMSPGLSVQTEAKTSARSSKKCAVSKTPKCMFLDLRNGGGRPRWTTAGEIMADGYSVAWRTLDAQFWGVPQRRSRVFLVADLGGQCAGEVCFKRKGLSRNFKKVRQAWKAAYRHSKGNLDDTGRYPPITLKIRSGCDGGGNVPLILQSSSEKSEEGPSLETK